MLFRVVLQSTFLFLIFTTVNTGKIKYLLSFYWKPVRCILVSGECVATKRISRDDIRTYHTYRNTFKVKNYHFYGGSLRDGLIKTSKNMMFKD